MRGGRAMPFTPIRLEASGADALNDVDGDAGRSGMLTDTALLDAGSVPVTGRGLVAGVGRVGCSRRAQGLAYAAGLCFRTGRRCRAWCSASTLPYNPLWTMKSWNSDGDTLPSESVSMASNRILTSLWVSVCVASSALSVLHGTGTTCWV